MLQLLAEGLSMKEVGARLGITARTVAFHKYQMIGKLGLRATADLVRFATEHRLAGQTALPEDNRQLNSNGQARVWSRRSSYYHI